MRTKILATKFEIKRNENYMTIMDILDILHEEKYTNIESTKQKMLEHCTITSFTKQYQQGWAEIQKIQDKIEAGEQSQK